MKKEENLFKLFLKYAVPSISAMWFFSIYTMIDGIFVGRGVGSQALAAVNLSMPFINTIFAVALLVAVGSSTLITYYFGKGKDHYSNNIFTLNFIILSLLGVTITLFTLLFLEEVALFLGATEETLPLVMDYLKIITIFSTFFMVAYSLEVLVKADGFPFLSIVVVIIAAIVNIFLDYLLVIRLDFGVKGAAIATGASQLISFMIFLSYFLWGNSRLKFIKPEINWSCIKDIFIIGGPESLTELSAGFTIFIFNFSISRVIGAEGLAAFGVIMYLNNLVIMTMIGINQGIQPLISYFNGKNETEKISKLLSLALKTGMVFSALFFLSSQFLTEQLVSLFIDTGEIEVFTLSAVGLEKFSFGFLLCSFNIILSGYFTALRKTKKAMIISLSRGYIVVALSLIIMPAFLGEVGIWMSPLLYESLTLLLAGTIFWRYQKKDKVTKKNKSTATAYRV
ncbi:MATE family efflux transporter [Proteinivorax tanatarense]|uniref:Multidrug export protein MepA n=1 Tax=Proteinivorax tanatarense TaxID=1260629 RepID=A0AAU7VPM2_9FIRM